MAIKSFTFDASSSRAFIRFGYDNYLGDSRWIPPLQRELRMQLSPRFSFYRKQGNRHKHFLATAGRRVVGRVSAFVNSDLHDECGTPAGAVGFFECAQEYAIARDLLDAATAWLCEEHGLGRIWGPMNFDIWHGYRFMTRGYEERPFYGEPYNKPFYPDYFERYGFVARRYWNSVSLDGAEALEKIISPGESRYREVLSRGYRFVNFDARNFSAEAHKLHAVLTGSFQRFWGFTRISPAEFEELFAAGRYALDPRFFIFGYDESNSLCGFLGAFLDLSDAVRSMKGKSHLLAQARFLYHRRRAQRIMIHLAGITPRESARRSGLARAGFYALGRRLLSAGYQHFLFTLMSEETRARLLLGASAMDNRRQYALYELNRLAS